MRRPIQRARPRHEARIARLRTSLANQVPRDHHETEAAFARRRHVVAGVSVAGAGLLGLSLSTTPGSPKFYATTLGVAGTWVVGGFASGPLHLGWERSRGQALERPLVTPILTGAGAFALVYGAALVARHIPLLDEALRKILRFAEEGSQPLVLLTTLANGVGEEVFFRGALYAAIGESYPVALSTAGYTLTTVATRNPALVVAAAAMGTLFGLQRRASGGIQASILTHLTWATLVVRYLPPLFCRVDTRRRMETSSSEISEPLRRREEP